MLTKNRKGPWRKAVWGFASGGSVLDGPSIVDGTVYWGSGYRNIPPERETTRSTRLVFLVRTIMRSSRTIKASIDRLRMLAPAP